MTSDDAARCMLVCITLKAPLMSTLTAFEPQITSLLRAGLQTFMAQWLHNVYIITDADLNGDFTLCVGIAWYYIYCTRELKKLVAKKILDYLNEALRDYLVAAGAEHALTEQLSILFVSAGEDGTDRASSVSESHHSFS